MNRHKAAVAHWYRIAVVGSIALPAILYAAVAWLTYSQALLEARERLERTSRIVQEHAARVVETNEVISRAVVNAIGGRSSEAVAASQVPLHELLRRLAAGLPQLHSLWVWGPDGRPLVASRFAQVPDINIADREYFVWTRDHPGSDWFVSRPLISRSTGEPFFNFSKRRERPDGSFDGAISVSLHPAFFANFYRDLARREPGLVVSLVRSDGALVATTGLDAAPPTTAAHAALMHDMQAGAPAGEIAEEGAAPEPARELAFRRIERLPLYAVVSVDRWSMLANWRREMSVLAGFAFPLAFVLAVVGWRARANALRLAQAVQAYREQVDQRAKAEAALQQAQKLEALGQITGGVAHDFNNVLMVIQSSNELARLQESSGRSAAGAFGAIERAVKTGAQLTRQLLTFARRQPLQLTQVSLGSAVPALLSLIQTTVGGQVTVRSEVAEDVGIVCIDMAEFELALINLAVNARDAMPAGGTLTVRVHAEEGGAQASPAGRHVVVSVEDTGEGVPPEILGRLFEPFFTTKPPGRGTGLGLSQVYGFATQAGGSVSIDSTPGRGTVVTLRLPLSDGDAAPPAAALASLPELAGRVLLVEDNDDIVASLVPLLEQLGLSVERCATADAALATLVARKADFDVVLSDIVMPGALSGVQLATELGRLHIELPVVLMSGYSAELQRAIERGFDVLPKPCSPAALAQALQAALARS
jgi:two-component system NtrC family sensor kinase